MAFAFGEVRIWREIQNDSFPCFAGARLDGQVQHGL